MKSRCVPTRTSGWVWRPTGHRRGRARRPPPGGLRAWGRTARRGPSRSSAVEGGDQPDRLRRFPRSRSSRLRGGGDPAHPRSSRVTIRTRVGLARGWKLGTGREACNAVRIAFPPGTGGLECGIVVKQEATESQLVVIGSSAGGIEALSRVVASLPGGLPGADRHRPAPRSAPAEPSRRDPRPPRDAADQGRRGDGRRSRTASSSSSRRTGSSRSSIGELRLRPARPGTRRAVGRPAARDGRGGLRSGPDRGDPDRQRQRRIGRRVARQAGRRRGRHREPGDRDVPVDAALDLAVARRRDGRPRLDRRGPARPARGRTAGARTAPRAASSRRCSTGSGSGAASTSAPTRPRRSSAGCGAGWARRATPSLADYAKQLESDPEEYARLISSLLIKVTEFFRDPKVFQLPPRPDPAGAHRGGAPARPAAAGLVGRLLDRRGGVLAGDHARRRRSATTTDAARRARLRDRHRQRGDRLRPARPLPAGGPAERAAALRERVLREVRRRLRGRRSRSAR